MKTITAILIHVYLVLFTPLPSSAVPRPRRQLPCTHPLRLSAPALFTHCDNASGCTYGTWSSWEKVPGSVTVVPKSLCSSGSSYTEQRTRVSSGSGCDQSALTETQIICLPSKEELLIIALGLGGSGNNYDPLNPTTSDVVLPFVISGIVAGPQVPQGPGPQGPQVPPGNKIITSNSKFCPQYGTTGQICDHIPGIGKRSPKHDFIDRENPKTLQANKLEEVNVKYDGPEPIAFDWVEHGTRLRQRRQLSCAENSVQNVLFVLDTSGSIGEDQFNRMQLALGKLTPLFCKQVRFALITFSSYVNLEFCFNCYENTFQGRQDAKSAIEAVEYRGGGTKTAATARCVCEELLTSSCGINSSLPLCLDVVFITDGKSNDLNLDVCEEVRCLHNRVGVNTYAIGINSSSTHQSSYNEEELDCINDHSDEFSAFKFDSFDEFESSITNIIVKLANALPNSPESCVRRDASLSPTGAPPF